MINYFGTILSNFKELLIKNLIIVKQDKNEKLVYVIKDGLINLRNVIIKK